MAVITGTFNSLVSGTITGVFQNTAGGVLSGVIGTPGPTGNTGATGAPGAPGQGVAAGGSTGQVLQKLSATSYDTGWLTLPADFITSVTSPLAVAAGVLSVDLSAYLPVSGGTLDASATIDASTATVSSTFAGDAFGVQLSANPSENSSLQYGGLQVQNAVGTMSVTPAGLTFPNLSAQTVAYPGSTGFLLKADNLTGLADTAVSRTNLGLGSLAVVNDAPSDGSQYARKNAAWDVVIPGDRYLTSSTTSLTINNANKTLTVGTGLSYTPTQNITISYDASNHMHGEVLTYNSGTGVLTVDINHHTGSGTYAAWVVNVGGVTPDTSVAWGAITGTLSTQTDLQNALNLKADLASPALTGNVTITSNSAGAALFIEQAGAGNILTLHDQASDTNFVAIDQNGKVNTIPSVTGGAGFNIPHGTAPTTFVNGDVWTTTGGLFIRINSGTQQFAALSTNNTFSNASSTYGNSTAAGTLNFGTGAVISGATRVINIGTASAAGSTNNVNIGGGSGTTNVTLGGSIALSGPITSGVNNISLGTGAAASVYAFGTGATTTGLTKTMTIGTGGLAGSTTNIAIGSTTGTSTTTLQGITNGITQTAGDSSLKLATTAFVTTADNLKADLASPTFTGTPTLPTGTIGVTQTAGDNTTAVATTAFVTAAVPAFATNAEVIVGTSSTKVLSPSLIPALITRPELRSFAHISQSAVQGSGAVTTGAVAFGQREMYLTTLATGRAAFSYSIPGNNSVNMSRTVNGQINFSKKIWLAGKCMCGTTLGATNYIGDTNTFTRITLGGYNSSTTGDMTLKGIGWKKQGGTSPYFNLTVHNGTTRTDVATTVQQSDGRTIDWQIYSDGAGNVTLYIDGAEAATTTAGPTGMGTTNAAAYREQVEAATIPAVRGIIESTGGWLYIEG